MVRMNLSQQVLCALRTRESDYISTVFDMHRQGQIIPKNRAQVAFTAFKICDDDDIQHFIAESENMLTDAEGLSFDAFVEILEKPSLLDQLSQSVPLWRLLSSAMPRKPGVSLERYLIDGNYPYMQYVQVDHLQIVSQLSPIEINEICEAFSKGLQHMLTKYADELQQSLLAMELKSVDSTSSSKFEVCAMNAGSIADFHRGLAGRIGSASMEYLKAMEAEHCTNACYDRKFTTLHNKTTTPKAEWTLLMSKDRLPSDLHSKRRIPDVDTLEQSELSKQANLRRFEIIAVILYTGPMFCIYNCMLRQHPLDVYEPFKDGGNTFSTSIHVLVSAVQKIARVTKVPNGLLLYRGLGATELPAHFFRADASTGCRGFAEWGFMSTTSNKAVAVQYSGIKQGKPLAMLFEIQASSVDRGACIKDFSQYPEEVEYLWVPCSFLEPWGSPYLEVTPHGVLKIVRVRVNANLKAPTVEELVELKKQMHLASFRYLPDEIRHELDRHAADGDAAARWMLDATRFDGEGFTLQTFLASIIDECQQIYSKHESLRAERYVDSEFYRGLVIEMLEVRTMAVSKFDFWLIDKSQMVMFQQEEPMRLAHRGYVAYLERTLSAAPEEDRRGAALRLCRIKGLLQGSLDDRNDLGENRIISAAAEGRDGRDLALLALAGADVNSVTTDYREDTACTVAASAGHAATLSCLSRLGADINKRSAGVTPLICAAQEGHEECLRVLLELGAEIEAREEDGFTSLHLAAQKGHAGCVKVLLDSGAAIESRVDGGMTPLLAAASQGMHECIEVLAAHGADLEARTDAGCTAAHLAARYGSAECLRALRALGADMMAKDCRGIPVASYVGNSACAFEMMAESLAQRGQADIDGIPFAVLWPDGVEFPHGAGAVPAQQCGQEESSPGPVQA